jgi:putative transposase
VARLTRLNLAHTLTYVRQYAVPGLNVFTDAAVCSTFIHLLLQAVQEHNVALHAFVLTPARYDLLLTPGSDRAVARLLQGLGRRFVRDYNRSRQRQGVLWRERYRSTLVDPDWGLACSRYIDTLAYRLGLSDSPESYPWSSAVVWLGQSSSEQHWRLNPLAAYWALANTPFERQSAYRALLLEQPLFPAAVQRLDAAVEKGWPLGEAPWLAQIRAFLPRRVEPLPRGRPARSL